MGTDGTERDDDSPFLLPTSGELLSSFASTMGMRGTLVEGFETDFHEQSERTVERYLAGKYVAPGIRASVFNELNVELDIFEEKRSDGRRQSEVAAGHLAKWDQFAEFFSRMVEAFPLAVETRPWRMYAAIRFLAIPESIRKGLQRHLQTNSADGDAPDFLEADQPLRRQIDRLAKRVGFDQFKHLKQALEGWDGDPSKSAVIKWRAGLQTASWCKPSGGKLSKLAEFFAEHGAGGLSVIEGRLQLATAYSTVLHTFGSWWPEFAVDQLFDGFEQLASLAEEVAPAIYDSISELETELEENPDRLIARAASLLRTKYQDETRPLSLDLAFIEEGSDTGRLLYTLAVATMAEQVVDEQSPTTIVNLAPEVFETNEVTLSAALLSTVETEPDNIEPQDLGFPEQELDSLAFERLQRARTLEPDEYSIDWIQRTANELPERWHSLHRSWEHHVLARLYPNFRDHFLAGAAQALGQGLSQSPAESPSELFNGLALVHLWTFRGRFEAAAELAEYLELHHGQCIPLMLSRIGLEIRRANWQRAADLLVEVADEDFRHTKFAELLLPLFNLEQVSIPEVPRDKLERRIEFHGGSSHYDVSELRELPVDESQTLLQERARQLNPFGRPLP